MAKAKKKAAAKKSTAAKKTAAAKKASAAKTKKAAAAKNGKTRGKSRGVGSAPGEMPYPMKLRGNLYLRFKAAAAELAALQSQREAVDAKYRALEVQPVHAPVFALIRERVSVAKEESRKRTEFAEIQLECAKKLGIPPEELRNYQFNSETGVVLPASPPD